MVQRTETLIAEAEPVAGPRTRSGLERTGVGKVPSSPGFYRRSWRKYRRNKVAMAGLAVMLTIVAFVLGADLVSEATGFTYQKGNLRNSLAPPFSEDHLLGTDVNGRDVLTRLAYGGRSSLMVAGLAAIATLFIGGTIGAVAGYFGGIVDSVLMRCVDVLLCLPGLSILILVSTLYQPGPIGLALVLAALSWAGIARLVRGEVLSLRSRDYVEAARVLGASNGRVIFKHIMPNVLPVMIVWISLVIPGIILLEAALSFLGFGITVPTPSWGNMLESAKDYYTKSWTAVFIPGLMIYVTALSIYLVGNGLRDALDPRLND